jgi:NTE family protein
MTAVRTDAARDPEVGLVLAGGGARGAYEAGALAALLPYLEQRNELPGIVLGTSIGALNSSHVAATAHLSTAESLDKLITLWREVQFSDIIGPLVSPRELWRVLLYVGGLLGIPQSRVPAVLDTTPLPEVLRRLIDFEQLHRNVDEALVALAVVATSYATGDSVVFHEGPPGIAVQADVRRAIRYMPSRIDRSHVQASASIPAAFPATRVESPAEVAAWYGDGGTRLNTPIKPALKLGAKRVIVIGLNSSAPPRESATGQPDVFDGAAQYIQALLADPVAQDVATLSAINRDVIERGQDGASDDDLHDPVPYIFIAPRDRLTVGQLAAETFREHLCGVKAMVRAPDMATLGHIVGAGNDAVRGELFSFLFFATEFHNALIDLGRHDAEHWLSMTHDEGPWRLGTPPLPSPPPPPTARQPRDKPARVRRQRARANV